LGSESLLDAPVHLTPAADLSTQLRELVVRGFDRRALLGDGVGERGGVAGQLLHLQPVAEEEAYEGDRQGQADGSAESHGPREVESEHPLAVAADDQQTELRALLRHRVPPAGGGVGAHRTYAR